jgi:uncharacterized protein YhaN
MYIKTLHIYGYGKFIDTTFNLDQGLHVFFGENEAGKSTILSFIHSVFFGFPTKNQLENRYEPKHGMRYGGKITLTTRKHGTVTIERLAGKAIGDVTVYFDNGSIGHEQELSEILQGIDKRIFTSIFSFGLHGLQEIHSISSEELTHYLFSSSVLGNDQVVELEKKIMKEMDSLFKPGGKKPEINQELEDITSLGEKVRAAKGQIEKYQSLLHEEQKIETELAALTKEVQRLSELRSKLELFEQYQPLKIEFNAIQEQQNQFGGYPSFPLEGMKRLELIHTNLHPIEARLKSLKKQHEEVRIKTSNLTINENLLNAEKEIHSSVSQSTINELAHNTLSGLEIKIEALKEEIMGIKKALGLQAMDEELLKLNLSLSQKEEIRKNLQVYGNVMHKKEILHQQQDQLKNKLVLTEEMLQQYEKQLLPMEKRKELKQLLLLRDNQESSSTDQKGITSKVDSLRNQINEHERREKTIRMFRNLFLIPMSIISFIYGLWNLLSTNIALAVPTLIFAALLSAGGILLTKYVGSHSLLSLLREEEQELQKQLQQQGDYEHTLLDHKSLAMAERLLAKEEQLEQLIQKETIVLSQLEKEYDKTIEQFEEWELQYHEITTVLTALKAKFHIPNEYSNESIYEIYEQINLLVSKILDLKKKEQEKIRVEQDIQSFHARFEGLARRLQDSLPREEITPLVLAQELEKEKDRKRKREILIEKQSELQLEIDNLHKETLYYQEQSCKLYDLAEVSDEEAFREKAALHLKWNELEERMASLREKIQLLLKNNEELENELLKRWDEFEELLSGKESLSTRYREYQETEKIRWRELANISLEKKQLEEKGTYSTLIHQLESKKSELMYKAKRWAKLSIAKELLSETKAYYHRVRLPSVVKKAESYFSILTEAEYRKLFPPTDINGFIVERKDGTRFSPQELSQGTTEQLYLALRLALAVSYQTTITVPLMIDDSFVNFDGVRLQITMKLVRALSRERQIIFFTCHKHVLSWLEGEGITYLEQESLSI